MGKEAEMEKKELTTRQAVGIGSIVGKSWSKQGQLYGFNVSDE